MALAVHELMGTDREAEQFLVRQKVGGLWAVLDRGGAGGCSLAQFTKFYTAKQETADLLV